MIIYRMLRFIEKKTLIRLACFGVWNLNNIKSGVVLIRLDLIGDFILWLDSAKEYRRIYPQTKITLIANSTWAEMAQGLPYWDEVWTVKTLALTSNPFYRLAFLRKVRLANFETAIQPTFSRAFMYGDIVIGASQALQRIGSVGDMANINVKDKTISDRWYTQLFPASPKPMMELLRNAEFISYLDRKTFKPNLPLLPLMAILPKHLQVKGSYIILFPGASWFGRCWPAQSFVEVGKEIQRLLGLQIVLCGALSERTLCQAIADSDSIASINLAGQTTLGELVELIRGAHLLIANETSAVHIAAALGTPTVCILGGGHYGRFVPYPDQVAGIKPVVAVKHMPCFNCNWQCNQPYDPTGPVPCISGVSTAQVLSTALQAVKDSADETSKLVKL